MWQHVKVSGKIRPRDTLARCWDVKQPTKNKQQQQQQQQKTNNKTKTENPQTNKKPISILLVNLPLQWTAGGVPAFTAEDSALFPCRVTLVTSQLAILWLHCQTTGVVGLVLELVGPVRVYCNWVRLQGCLLVLFFVCFVLFVFLVQL